MAGPFALAFFWLAAISTVVANLFIIRGTVRAMRRAPVGSAGRGFWEWVWVFLPALCLVLLFWATWQAMHPTTFSVTLPADKLIPGALR